MGLERRSLASETSADPKGVILSVTLLGKLCFHAGGDEIDLLSRKTRALLGYLALAEAQEESRERLVGLFWSEVPEERARASLRQALHEIRNALSTSGFTGFRTDKLAVAFDRTQIRVDVIDVVKDAASGIPHPRLLDQPNQIDDILAEVENSDPAFQTWLTAKRQTLRDQIIRHLETCLRAEKQATGAWWKRQLLGVFTGSVTRDSTGRIVFEPRSPSS